MRIVFFDRIDIQRVETAYETVGFPFDDVPTSDELAMMSLVLAVCKGLVGAVHLQIGNLVSPSSLNSRFNLTARNLGKMQDHVADIFRTSYGSKAQGISFTNLANFLNDRRV